MRKTDADFICRVLRESAHMRINAEDPRESDLEDMPEIPMLNVVKDHVYRKYINCRPRHNQDVLVRAKNRDPEVRLYVHNERDEAWCRFVRQHDSHWYGALCEGTEWMPLP